MLSDLLTISKWWLYILLLGIIFLPFSQKYFRRFVDKGYMFSKCLGIVVTSYIVWLLSSLHILRFSRAAELSVIAVIFAAVFIAYRKHVSVSVKTILVYAAEELLFFCMLLFWSYVRGHQPDIYGLEKFMDFGFINSLLRTDYMPPIDIWHAGLPINYYYFGHYMCAFLVRLTGIEASASYNLMLALVFAFTFMMSFSIAANTISFVFSGNTFRKAVIAGLISASLVALGGNLHCFVYEYARPLYLQAMHLPADEHEYFYPDSTRYIGYNPSTHDKTIHEFPIYSFVVSDLHGHVSDIPVVLTFLAFLLVPAMEGSYTPSRLLSPEGFIPALFLAVMYMTNTWDYPIYLTVFILVTIYCFIARAICRENSGEKKPAKAKLQYLLFEWLKVILLSQLFILPFKLKFLKIAGGVDLVHAHTPLYQFLILWGHQLFFMFSLIIFILIVIYRESKHLTTKEAFKLILGRASAPDMYMLVLCLSAFGLLIIPEIVYVVDIYSGDYHRANTMFKLTYQAFIMAGLAAGYITVRMLEGIRQIGPKLVMLALFCIMIVLPLLYPFAAIKGYYDNLKVSTYKGLYGMEFLNRISAGDAAAVKWFNENIKGQPAILEADGDSYSSYERISSMTGLPTVEGWFVHEWLWRSSRQDAISRSGETAAVYESDDLQKTISVIRKYNIEYIVVGTLEKARYKNIKVDKLLSLGNKVFESDGTMVIKVKK